MERTFHRREFGWLLLVAALLLWAVPLWSAGKVNAWSLAFARPALVQGLGSVVVSEPPVTHHHAPIWLALQTFAHGEPHLAQPWREALYTAAMENPFAARILGQVLWAQGQITDAIQTWLHARNYHALLDAARQAQEAGRLEDALSAYRAARVVDPQNGTLPLVNFLWWQCGGKDAAESLLRQALVQYPDAEKRLDWQYRLGEMLRDAERWDEVLVLYRQLLNDNPNDWRVHIGLGWTLYHRGGEKNAAEKEFRQAIALTPERGEGYFAMGQLLVKEGRYIEADTWFAQAIQRNPDVKWWWLTRANAARSSGNLEQALALYQETVTRFPDWAPAYYEMAWNYRLMERRDEALQTIKQALSLTVIFPDAWYYVRAGQISPGAGGQAVAGECYRKTVQRAPKNIIAVNGIERWDR